MRKKAHDRKTFCDICNRQVPADLAEVYESGEAVCFKCLSGKER